MAGLKSKGVRFDILSNGNEILLANDNSYHAWFSDPDGNRVELHQYTEKSWQAPSLK